MPKIHYLFLWFLICILISCSRPVSEQSNNIDSSWIDWNCDLHEKLYTQLNQYSGVYIGEIHGQSASAELVYCLTKFYTDQKRSVSISLEVDNDWNDLEKWWNYGQEGSSVATPEMRCALQLLASSEKLFLSGHVEPVKTRSDGSVDIAARELSYAENILEDWMPDSFLISVSGNLHAARTSYEENGRTIGRAAYYLPEEIMLLWVRGAGPGSLRTCPFGGECGVMEIPGAPGNLTPFSISETERVGYDFEYIVPQLQATSDEWDISLCRLP